MLMGSKLSTLEVVVTTLLTLLLVIVYRLYRFLRPPRIPGIPSIPDNSILGSTRTTEDPGMKVHAIALAIAKEKGPIFQSRLLGSRLITVSDKNLVRIAMRDVIGKGGIFHELLSTKRKGFK